MTVSPVDIAEKRRVLDLLQKMRAGETLTRGQLSEVKAYQKAQAASGASGKKPPKLSRVVPAPPKKKKKTKRARKKAAKAEARAPISQADVKRLAFHYESIAQADQYAVTQVPLVDLLIAFPKLMAAWGRGELLRRLQACASVLDNVHDVAHDLGFANGKEVRAWFDCDREAYDLWKQTRFVTRKRAMAALVEAAVAGNQKAIQLVADKLDEERPAATVSGKWHTIRLKEMETMTGKSRSTLYRWRNGAGMPAMGGNKTMRVDLRKFFPWFEKYIIGLMTKGIKPADNTSPLQQRKIRDLDIDHKLRMGELLARGPQIGWHTSMIINVINGFAVVPTLVNDMHGLTREEMAVKMDGFRDDLLFGMRKVPDCLRLPPAAERKLVELYDILVLEPVPIDVEPSPQAAPRAALLEGGVGEGEEKAGESVVAADDR